MLLAYECKNFKSIGDTINFSMVASVDKELEENVIQIKDRTFLKEALIYGANGTGKSNFIDSISYLKWLIVTSVSLQPGQSIFTLRNKKKLDENIEFQIQFISHGIRYLYGVSFNNIKIDEEFLYYYPNERSAKIFDRKKELITYGDSFKKALTNVQNNFLKPNNLLFSCAANYSNITEINNAFLFFTIDLVIYNEASFSNWNLYSARTSKDNPQLKQCFLEFLKRIGMSNLKDIESEIKEIPATSIPLPSFFNDEFKNNYLGDKCLTTSIKFNYEGYDLDIKEESLGVQKLFAIFFPFYDIIMNGKAFICDEFEVHLHPLIVKELINFFKENSKNSQLIFTTHDVNLLDLEIFRRDQIWFTELDKNNFTKIYSLAELKNVRKNENISKNYLLGKYYGIPTIKKDVEVNLAEGNK